MRPPRGPGGLSEVIFTASRSFTEGGASRPLHPALGTAVAGALALRLTTGDHSPDLADAVFAVFFAAVGLVPIALGSTRGRGLGMLAVVVAVAATAVAASWHPFVSLLHLPLLLTPFVTYLAVRRVFASGRLAILLGVGGAAAVSALVALVQRFYVWPDAIARQDRLGLTGRDLDAIRSLRPFGLQVSPDLMGATSLVGCLFALAALLHVSRRPLRGVSLVLAGVCGLGVVVSRSAGVLLAAVVAASVILALGPRRRGVRFAILGGTALALAVGFRGADALARSAAERWANWSVATDIGLAHPLGVGLGRLSAAYLEARPPDANVTRYAHSTLFQAFGEAGWPGVVLVLVVLAGFARLAVLLRSWRMTHGSLPTREALVAGGTFALLARAFVDYDLQIGRSAALIGAAAALALGAAEGEGAKAPKVADGPVALGRRVLAGAVVVALLVVAFFVGEHHRAVAPFEVGEDPPDYESVVHLVDYAARRPGDVDAQVIATRLRLGELQRCRTDCEALEASMAAFIDDQLRRPHPSPDVVLAGASLAHYRGDVEEALRLVRDALARDPSSLRAHTLRLSVAWTHDHPELAPALELARRYLTPAQLEEAYDRAGLPPD